MPRFPAYRLRAFEGESPAVAEFLNEAGWSRAWKSDGDWQLWWDTDVPTREDFLDAGERLYNHLPGTDVLGIKSLLATSLEATRVRAEERGRGEAYDFFPRTYLLPQDAPRLQRAAARMPGASWIRKPKALSRGRGVEVLASAADAGLDPEKLIQEYVERPHLIDGHKYSLRCYVLVTSLEPLVAYLFHDGFAKLASRPFSLSGDAKLDRFRHLTNPDVLKEDTTVATSSMNLTHQNYRARLRREGHDDARLFAGIRAIVQKTLVATRDAMMLEGDGLSQAHRFELFGFDITVDEALRPILIECNTSPSLAIAAEGDTPAVREERDVKHRVSRDLVALLAPEAGLPWPTSDAELAASVEAQTARGGGFERIFPAPETAELLGDFVNPAAADVKLAAALGLLPRLSARSEPAAAGKGAHLVAAENGALAFLDDEDAALWKEVGTPNIGMQHIDAAQAGRIAAWLADGLLGVSPEPAPPPPLHAWNQTSSYELGSYWFAVGSAGVEGQPQLEQALRPLRSGRPGLPPRAWHVSRHLDGFAIHDPRGARRWRGELEQLAGALSSLVRAEAALVNGELGWLDAALLRSGDRSALVLLPAGGARALSVTPTPTPLELLARPVHLRAGDSIFASASAGAPGVTPELLVKLTLDLRGAPDSREMAALEACDALFSSSAEGLRADPAHAKIFARWLAQTRAVELTCRAAADAREPLVALLSPPAR